MKIGVQTKSIALDQISATTTSPAIDVAGAKDVGILFTEGGTVLNRSGVLTITASMDGENGAYVAYNMLIDNVVNTNAQTLTRIASKTRAAAGSDILFLTPEIPLTHIKVTVTVTDGATPTGSFSVKVLKEY